MKHIPVLRVLVAAAVAIPALAAFAAGDLEYPTNLRTTMPKMAEMTDRNKDGIVTRKEFLEMQGKMFDMGAKKGRMTMDEFKAFLSEYRSFGQ